MPRPHSLQWSCIKPQMNPTPKPQPLLAPFHCILLIPQEAPPPQLPAGLCCILLSSPSQDRHNRLLNEDHLCSFSFYKSLPNRVLSYLTFFTLSEELPSHLVLSGSWYFLGGRQPQCGSRKTPLQCTSTSGTHLWLPTHNRFMKNTCVQCGIGVLHLEEELAGAGTQLTQYFARRGL